MTAEEITLICVFGPLGYLLVGWVTMVIGAAITSYRRVSPAWLLAVPLWPGVALIGLVVGAGFMVARLGPVSLRAIRRFNPDVEEWESW